MPKNFRKLSSRQKNRGLEAYERHEYKSILHHVDKPIVSTGVTSLKSLADINVPLRQCTLPDDSNSDNVFNVFSADIPSSDVHVNVELQDKENIEGNIYKTTEFSDWLRSWKVKHNVTHTAFSELLSKLRTCGYTNLPKDARTLLNTPRNNIVVISAENGSFFHYGLRKVIIEQLTCFKFIVKNEVIMIDLNIDGLLISKSSKSQIWPILGKIYGNKAFTPFIISAYQWVVGIQNHLL